MDPRQATTTYLGHRISLEPFEWGFIAHVVGPDARNTFVVGNATMMGALERAFEGIDERLSSRSTGPTGQQDVAAD
jgi:hypothetical protein